MECIGEHEEAGTWHLTEAEKLEVDFGNVCSNVEVVMTKVPAIAYDEMSTWDLVQSLRSKELFTLKLWNRSKENIRALKDIVYKVGDLKGWRQIGSK